MSPLTKASAKVIKRDGKTSVDWNPDKIKIAIQKAAKDASTDINGKFDHLLKAIEDEAFVRLDSDNRIGVDDIQQIVKRKLMDYQFHGVAEEYILYSRHKDDLRKTRLDPDPTIIEDLVVRMRYSRYREDLKRRETYEECVDRVHKMHADRYPQIKGELDWVMDKVRDKQVLGSMRSMQFGGPAQELNHAKGYNCSFSVCNRPKFFAEAFWLLLSGTGVGFSVQFQHVDQLPELKRIDSDNVKHFAIPDTIEGWADAAHELIRSYMHTGTYVEFSYGKIRPKGSPLKTSGGKAPGHLPLKQALDRSRSILDLAQGRHLRPIECYDIMCSLADAVYAGGIREAAMICLFSIDDGEMMNAKTGKWGETHPWRARSNNSVVLHRKETKKRQYDRIFKSTRQWGEPGFYFTNDEDTGANPCFTGNMKLMTSDGYKTIEELWENGGRQEYASHKTLDDYGVQNIVNSHGRSIASNVFRTSKSAKVYRITLQNGDQIETTSNHQWIVLEDKRNWRKNGTGSTATAVAGRTKIRKQCKDLKIGDRIPLAYPQGSYDYTKVKAIEYIGKKQVYCLNEPSNNEVFINTIQIGQCVEIGLNPKFEITPQIKVWTEKWAKENGKKTPKLKVGSTYWGWQQCNLSEVNCATADTTEEFYDRVKAAAILGTAQAGYTDFGYLGWVSEAICTREALLGVSLTGIMDNPDIALSPEVQKTAAQIAVETNIEIANKIGIRSAARVTCVKPSGTASLVLGGVGAGHHCHHARRYFRRIRVNPQCEAYKEFKKHNPHMCITVNKNKDLLMFPVKAPDGALIRSDFTAVEFLERVMSTQKNWVSPGTAKPDSSPGVTHNVSNTISVKEDEWDDVKEFLWKNKKYFSGVSMLAFTGDKEYENAPFEEISTDADEAKWKELISNYTKINWEDFHEEEDNTDLSGEAACAGGTCQINL